MQNRKWILALFCLATTPLNASIVGIDFGGNSDLLPPATGNHGQHDRRNDRDRHFTGTFEIERPGTWRVNLNSKGHGAPLSELDIELTAGKDHIIDFIRDEDGFIVEAPPGKYGFSILARKHNRAHADDFDFDVIPSEVNLTAVPLPAAAWLFGSGLVGLVISARRKLSWQANRPSLKDRLQVYSNDSASIDR